MLASTLALAAALLGSPIADSPVGTVRGQVRSEQLNSPLPFATIEILADGKILSGETRGDGAYEIRGVPAGRRVLRVRHLDHAPLEVEVLVPAGGEVVLDLVLDLRPVTLPEMTARADPAHTATLDSLPVPVAELGATAVRALEATPGMAELGLADAWKNPGHEPVDPSDVLYVRGSATDIKLVLLDGAPVYAPFHLGGLINAFESDMLESANLYLGGAPARYDGGLSYVLDMQTRDARTDRPRATAAVDLLSARGMVEGPVIGNVSYLAGARTVHGLGTDALARDAFPYAYEDGLARIDLDGGLDGRLSVTSFWNRESVVLDSFSVRGAQARWGNAAVSVRYRGELAGAEADLTAAVGNFHADLPVGGSRPLLARGLATRGRMAADFVRDMGHALVAYGASLDRLRLHYQAWPAAAPEAGDSLLLGTEAVGHVIGVYGDGAWQPARWLRLRGGLRADVFSLEGGDVRLAPRAAATWLLTERVALTLAAGRYHQYVRAPEPALLPAALVPVDEAGNTLEPLPPLSVASASHVTLALDQDLGGGVRLGIEGFYKSFDGVPGTGERLTQASGMDLWARRNHGEITGWLGYSLAWVWSVEEDVAEASDLFSGRHLLSTGVGGPLGPHARFDVRLAYGAGLPFTAVPEPSMPTPPLSLSRAALLPEVGPQAAEIPVPPERAEPGRPYLRVDAGVSRSWHSIVRGTEVALTPYLRVLNALGRRDALFYIGGDSGLEPRPLAAVPLIPVVGLEASF